MKISSKNIVIMFLAITVSSFGAAENGSSFQRVRTTALRKNGENQGQGGTESHATRAVLEVDETDITYKVGTPVSVKNVDGSWSDGKIVKHDNYGYTIKWDEGEKYVVGHQDGEIHQLVNNAIAEAYSISSTEDMEDMEDDIEDIPIETMDPEDDSKSWSKKSTITLLFVAGIFGAIWYIRHNKLVAISSTKKSQGGIWKKNDQRRTSLSIQMDETKNLHSIRSIM